jgi:glycosyltransferase involved in cell wall biosynthesis
MKITLIGTLPPIKAISPYCFHLTQALSKIVATEFITFKKVVPDFFYIGGMKEQTKKIYKIENANIKAQINWCNPFSWIKAGLQSKGDIIHIQHWIWYSSIIYCIILPIVKLRGKKSILTIHNITPHTDDFITNLFNKIINKIIFPFADVFIVHNKRNKEKFLELYHINENKIFIIPHGSIEPYEKIKNISQSSARKYLNIPTNKKVILFFGYIWGYKGLDVLIKSLSIVKDIINDLTLIIAGQPLRDWTKYEVLIKKNKLSDYIIKILKYIPDSETEYYYSCADLVVLPYKEHQFDTHGGIGALAISFNKPIVVTDVGGLPEYVKDKRAISKPNNINDLAQKIIFILKDEVLLNKLSKDSEQLSKELTWEKIADITVGIYNKL